MKVKKNEQKLKLNRTEKSIKTYEFTKSPQKVYFNASNLNQHGEFDALKLKAESEKYHNL